MCPLGVVLVGVQESIEGARGVKNMGVCGIDFVTLT